LDQVLKIPVLVVHYHEHKQANESISFMQFLSMHYWGTDDNDNDQDRDMQLPYKTVHIHSSTYIPLVKTAEIKMNDVSSSGIVYPLLNNNDMPNPALTSLFRPPQA
jgi:hypothetical protein